MYIHLKPFNQDVTALIQPQEAPSPLIFSINIRHQNLVLTPDTSATVSLSMVLACCTAPRYCMQTQPLWFPRQIQISLSWPPRKYRRHTTTLCGRLVWIYAVCLNYIIIFTVGSFHRDGLYIFMSGSISSAEWRRTSNIHHIEFYCIPFLSLIFATVPAISLFLDYSKG